MKILFLCAHPDDLEFSVPGMMITLGNNIQYISTSLFSSKYSKKVKNKRKKTRITKVIQRGRTYLLRNSNSKDQELKVKIACMTRGEMSEFTDRIHSTIKAAKIRTWELNGSQNILTGGEPDHLLLKNISIKSNPILLWHQNRYLHGIIMLITSERVKSLIMP